MADNFDMVSCATLKVGEENRDTGRRQAFRAEPPGLYAHIRGIDGFFSVNDISAGGLNLKLGESDLCVNPGNIATLDILIANRRYLAGLQAQVVRVVNMEPPPGTET